MTTTDARANVGIGMFDDEQEPAPFKALTAAEAQDLRKKDPSISP